MRMKIWKTLAGASLAIGACDAAVAQALGPSGYPGGTIEHALEKMFDGEGGEGGLGMTDLADGRFSVPALKNDQIVKAVGGNTIRSGDRFALHFSTDGRVEGWTLKWTPAPASACAEPRAKGYALDDGQCIASTEIPVRGAWSARGDKLCMPGVFASPFDIKIPASRCYSLALAINSVLAFDEAGKLVRRPMSLVRGDARGKLAD
ncbi:hypothetical protein [Phenylobacterium sp.]|uniref:hypothetical protein n=1 Tax=Phenylobacterium sp. TaxID=1871053 RepID=UPI002FC8E1CA